MFKSDQRKNTMLPERVTVRAQRTRAAILEAALILFKEGGFAATTMREIAERAGVAVGAAYYHFRTKDDIVFAFYAATQEDSERRAKQRNSETKIFAARVNDIIEFKLSQLAQYREFLGQLASHALVPRSPLSPFSKGTSEVRARAVAVFDESMQGSDLKVAAELKPHLPGLLWLYQMAVILYWLHDTSEHQAQTKKLISVSQSIIMKLIGLSRIPLLRPVNRTISSLLELFPASIDEEQTSHG